MTPEKGLLLVWVCTIVDAEAAFKKVRATDALLYLAAILNLLTQI